MMLGKSNMKKQRGLSMIELMVAMTISAILLLGVSMIFVSNKKTYQTQDALSGVQEAGRFALMFLSEPIQMAGYTGCGNLELIPAVDIRKTANQDIELSSATRGFESRTDLVNALSATYPSGTWGTVASNWVAGTDILSLY
jgi:type IV pilus assembly protein PilW